MPSWFKKIAFHCFLLFFVFGFTRSFSQSVNLKDFEKMNSVKSPKEYLAKKDFTVKSDSSNGENFKLRLINRGTRELINVSVYKDSEGARLVEVEYFTPSQEEYAKIVHTITKSGYNAKTDNRHYEKRVGSYEAYNLVLRELVTLKDKDYYGIKYSYYAGKELSMPPAVPAEKNNDWSTFPH